MTEIQSWDPKEQELAQQRDIDTEVLRRFAGLCSKVEGSNAKANAEPPALNDLLDDEEIEQQRFMMTSHKDKWESVVQELSDTELRNLVLFFTLAEMQLSGWEAGSKSPVVWLCRALKQRGAFPDKALIQWIKEHSDNRFLPYGNPLDF